ncbi:hypothetical protein OOU_Y34scaffold00645g9 [Pyricularia oryzae Y34]|nr:hypothetical protein OOU_Y34scaffold00645g9 [Pyricularia oryzae Y34]
MKGFKGLGNKMLGGMKRKPTNGSTSSAPAASGSNLPDGPDNDTPEAIAIYNARKFCESGGGDNAGDEVTFLPAIVDAAESSPVAAAECARIIRKYLHKDYTSRPSFQYNAIMLMRILADNPGMTFTRSLDKKFIDTSKELLRYGRDFSVRQMLMETLDAFEATKSYDEGLQPILEMWKKEKEKAYKAYGIPPGGPPRGPPGGMPPNGFQQQNYFSRHHTNRRLPEPIELANRLEEARTSAKLLQQVVACTPPAEVLDHELIQEFANRCLSASRSIQGYMTAENPSPDNDTMESLIDTNEQLQTALNLHQRAVLNARKQQQQAQSPTRTQTMPANGMVSPLETPDERFRSPDSNGLSLHQPMPSTKALGKQAESSRSTPRPEEDPFRDPVEEGGSSSSNNRAGGSSSRAGGASGKDNHSAYEPLHVDSGGGFVVGSTLAAGLAPGEGRGSDPAVAAAAADSAPRKRFQQTDEGTAASRTRNRGMTQGSAISDLYDDSGDERYGQTTSTSRGAGKAVADGPIHRY